MHRCIGAGAGEGEGAGAGAGAGAGGAQQVHRCNVAEVQLRQRATR